METLRFTTGFSMFLAQGRSRPKGAVDSSRSLFSCIFKMLRTEERNPSLSSLGSKARSEIVLSSTAIEQPDAPVLMRKKFILFLSSQIVPSDNFISLRRRAITLYLTVLGRRPSNASVALWPDPSKFNQLGVMIVELGAKKDNTRKGSRVFLQHSQDPNLCLVCAIIAYMRHPNTQDLVNKSASLQSSAPPGSKSRCICHAHNPLFLNSRRGMHGFALAKATCSNIVKLDILDADCRSDPSGRKVSPRDFRSSLYSLCLRSNCIALPIVRHMLAWKQKSCQDNHYLLNASPVGWSEFALGKSESFPSPQDFINLNEIPSTVPLPTGHLDYRTIPSHLSAQGIDEQPTSSSS